MYGRHRNGLGIDPRRHRAPNPLRDSDGRGYVNGYFIGEREDLYRADLAGANLRGANLVEADLVEADLHGSDLRNAHLSEADLRDANLSGADLTKASIFLAKLRRANLTGAKLEGANLWAADLSGANLTGADLTGADLEGAILTGATMPDGTIYSGRAPNPGYYDDEEEEERLRHNAFLWRRDSEQTPAKRALHSAETMRDLGLVADTYPGQIPPYANILRGEEIKRAHSRRGFFDPRRHRSPNPSTDKETGTYLVDGVGTVVVNEGYTYNDEYEIRPGANLARAYLAETDLRGAKLDFANLRGTVLTETDLRDASLVGADLTRADLTGANLQGANLQGADLTGATMPDGTIYSGRAPNPGYGHHRGYGRRR